MKGAFVLLEIVGVELGSVEDDGLRVFLAGRGQAFSRDYYFISLLDGGSLENSPFSVLPSRRLFLITDLH